MNHAALTSSANGAGVGRRWDGGVMTGSPQVAPSWKSRIMLALLISRISGSMSLSESFAAGFVPYCSSWKLSSPSSSKSRTWSHECFPNGFSSSSHVGAPSKSSSMSDSVCSSGPLRSVQPQLPESGLNNVMMPSGEETSIV